MISLTRGNIAIEGQLGDLITEAARLLDAVASTIEKRSEDDEIDYNFVMEAILEHVIQIKRINPEGNIWGEEEEINFFKQAQEIRSDHKRDGSTETFIDYDSGAGNPKEGKSHYGKKLKDTTNISGGIKLNGHADFYIDPRVSKDDLMDIDDLKKRKK